MKHSAILLAGVLFGSAICRAAEMEPMTWINPYRLQKAVRREGPVKLASRLPPDALSYVLAKTSTGAQRWVTAAHLLREGLKGPALKDWVDAMSLALARNPKAVLSTVDEREISEICSPEDAGHPSVDYHSADARITRLDKSLRSVKDKNLVGKKNICRRKLAAQREDFSAVFDR